MLYKIKYIVAHVILAVNPLDITHESILPVRSKPRFDVLHVLFCISGRIFRSPCQAEYDPQQFHPRIDLCPGAASAFFSRRSQAREQAKQQNHSFHLFCTTMFKYSTSVSRFLQNPFPSPGRPWAATAKTSFFHLDELAPKKVTSLPAF